MSNLKRVCFYLILLAVAFFLMDGKAFAQTTLVTVEGVVSDAEGSVLPGVGVMIKNMETGYELHATTRSDGSYIISGIQPGKYEIEVTLPGFTTQKRSGLTFAVGAKMKIDFSLAPATIEEEVTVVAESPMVEVTKSEISSVVDRHMIEELPLLDRDFADLSITTAGVVGGGANAAPIGMNETLIDGMSNENIIQNSNRLGLPADAVQEFRLMVNQFEAEYGNASGFLRSAITRSGTNEYKGRLAYFYRDEILDTPNYFVNHDKYKGKELPKDEWEKAEYSHHNPSGFIGGPIIKDKAHFFLAYEGFYRTTYDTITSPLVPKETIDVPEKDHLGVVKLSYQPNEKHLLSLRYSPNYERVKNAGVGGFYTKERAYEYAGNTWELQLNWIFYPTENTMNELRGIYVIDDHNFDPLPEFADKYSISRPSGYFGKNNNFAQYNFADRYQVVDNFSLFLGKHTIKTGFDFMYVPSGCSVFDMYIPGEIMFQTDKPFDPNDPETYPYQFMYNKGEPAFTLYIYEFAAFLQDSWRANPRLTLNYGLRYSYYSYTGLDLTSTAFSNFNPRFAFSWDPVGDGKTVVRGGIGTYTANVVANIAFPNEFYKDVKLAVKFYPGYPDPFQPNPFRTGSEVPITFDEYEVESAENPYTLQITLGAQREIYTDFSVGFDLVWTKGYHMMMWDNKNPIIPGTAYIHEDPNRGNVWYIVNRGKSDYKGLYLTLNKRYSKGWALNVAYTLGKAVGDTERQDRPWSYDKDCWDRAWGPKDNDARHQVAVSGIVDLPLGFQMSGIIFYRSAYPFNAAYSYDLNKDGLRYDFADQYRNSRRAFDYFRMDARLSKYIRISRFSFQLFAEMYNVTNQNNFYNTYRYIDREGFGEPRSAYDPRLVQLGARFSF